MGAHIGLEHILHPGEVPFPLLLEKLKYLGVKIKTDRPHRRGLNELRVCPEVGAQVFGICIWLSSVKNAAILHFP